MPKKVTNAQLDHFAKQVKELGSIDFASVAEMLNLNWFKDIRPKLDTDLEFREKMEEVLESMKYELYQKMFKVARDGKGRNGRDPEVSFIKAVIQCIDSGALLGKAQSDTNAVDSGETTEELRKRMGLVNSPESEAD